MDKKVGNLELFIDAGIGHNCLKSISAGITSCNRPFKQYSQKLENSLDSCHTIRFFDLPLGFYNIEVACNGYITGRETFHVKFPGKDTHRNGHFRHSRNSKRISLVRQESKWMAIAKKEIGQTEIVGSNHNPKILEYHSATSLKATTDEVPWCASFVNWVMEKAGYKGTRNASALSWKSWGRQLNKAAYGSIAIFDFGRGMGHVGFVLGKQGEKLLILGGNQSNSVKVTLFETKRIVAYAVPSSLAFPVYKLKEFNENYERNDFASTR